MSAKPIAKTNAKAPQKASKKVIVSKAPAIAPTLSKSRSVAPKAAISKTARPAPTEVKAPASTSTGKASLPTLMPIKTESKQAQLISILKSAPGATIDQMMKLTGWQAHTVRGTISGALRKRLGLTVQCTAIAGSRRTYRIVEGTQA